MSYRYTEKDLLAQPPYHYTYSLFEGLGLLTDYAQARRVALANLHKVAFPPAPTRANILAPRETWNDEIDTDERLCALVDYVQAGNDVRAPVLRGWVDVFIAKFEPGKRLWQRYGRDLAVVDRTPIERAGYAQLAFVVARCIAGPDQLRLINVLLKLNDIVLSGPPLDGATAALVVPAVERELSLVATLSAQLRVAPMLPSC